MSDVISEFFDTHKREQHFTAGETVIHANDLPTVVFLLKEGFVKAYSIDKTGSKHLHMIFSPGKCFPLLRALQGKTNQILCEAHSDVVVSVAPVDEFLKEVNDNHKLALALLDQTVAQFSSFTNRIENLQYSSAQERLLYRLLTLAGSFGANTSNGYVVSLGLTHTDLASSIQVSREVVTRLLRQFRSKGLVVYDRASFTVHPSALLAELRDNSLALADFGL